MAYSDARNERDRAETGRNSSNHGGGDAKAAEARNREAMGLKDVTHNFDTRMRNVRYNQNTIATRPATLNNIANAITGGIPTPSTLGRALLGGAITGNYDPYSGPRGSTTGFSYDGPNRFGVNGSTLFPRPKPGVTGVQPIGAAGQPQPMAPALPPSMVPPAMLSVPGGDPYGVNLPAFGYFGTPGQTRPGAAPGMPPMAGPMAPPMAAPQPAMFGRAPHGPRVMPPRGIR